MEIIPGILAKSKKEFEHQLKAVSWASKIHIDIMDGKFVSGKTPTVDVPLNAQVHLMVEEPIKYVKKCLNAKNIIVHAESKNVLKTLQFLKKKNKKIGIAFNPKTRITKIIKLVNFVLVMTVNPGRSGRKMITAALSKVKAVKKIKEVPVVIDGGVNEKTISYAKRAGADFVIATSAVTLSKDPKKSWQMLKKLI